MARPLEQAVAHLAERCRHPDIDLFAATIRLQDRSGGNLTGLLKMNAHTVRERHKLRLKIQAASSEGRVSAMILTSAPFVVLRHSAADPQPALLRRRDPRDADPVSAWRVIGGWMLLGNLVMRRMIDMRI